MSDNGTVFEIVTLRATETDEHGSLGDALLRNRRFLVTLEPIVRTGRTEYDYYPDGTVFARWKEPYTFQHFEFVLQDARRFWRGDRRLTRILRKPSAVEFWTTHVSDGSPDGWVHWIFPYTTWEKIGWGRYSGRSHEGAEMRVPDSPDHTASFANGGFFKTQEPPPKALVA